MKTKKAWGLPLAAIVLLLAACGNDTEEPHRDVITTRVIQNVTAPVVGGTPVTVITTTTQFSGTVAWSPEVTGTFAGGTAYTATIRLTAKEGFTFSGVAANFFTVAGATATNAANSGVVTAAFLATMDPVISGITVPVAGEAPVTTVTETAQYTGIVEWTPTVAGTFAYGTIYTATITLVPKTGYTLVGVPENFFTVAGATTVSNEADYDLVMAVFPITGAPPITGKLYAKAPPISAGDTEIDLSTTSGGSTPAKAVTYINANSTASSEYTLVMALDTECAPQTLNADNFKLTILGESGERKITLSSTGALFTVGAAGKTGISLTLGNNITLVGRADNNAPMVKATGGGAFTMLEGSKITGNTAPYTGTIDDLGVGVNVIANGVFTMKGGTITENTITGNGYEGIAPAGVCIGAGGKLVMQGGSITGNSGLATDAPYKCDVYVRQNVPPQAVGLELSGNAVLGVVNIANSANNKPTMIAIGSGGWTGSMEVLNMRANVEDVASLFVGETLLSATGGYTLTTADIAKFLLGQFLVMRDAAFPLSDITATHKIADSGADIGKLVVK